MYIYIRCKHLSSKYHIFLLRVGSKKSNNILFKPACNHDEHNDCDANAICSDLPGGSYKCECNNGYFGSGTECADIDECSGTNSCDSNASCSNTAGSYRCPCNEGYTGYETYCRDIDECAGLNWCPENSDCTNTYGSYTCSCKENYLSDGRQCHGTYKNNIKDFF